MKHYLFIFLVLFSLCGTAYSFDLYNLTTINCQNYSGLIVSVNENNVAIVDFNGRLNILPKKVIQIVLIYGANQNGFKKFITNADSHKHLMKLYVIAEKQVPVYGYPVKFVEDVMFFYSVDSGKVRIVSYDEIYKIRPYDINHIPPTLTSYKSHILKKANYISKCKLKDSKGQIKLRPVKKLTDKIKIDEFFLNFKNGYQHLDNLRERTYLYAKPYLFEKRNRLQIPYFKDRQESSENIFYNFQWSTGKDYHFQSVNSIGSALVEWLPLIEPAIVVRTEFKSHFFNGVFIGNLLGLSQGKSLMDVDDFTSNHKKAGVNQQFNYMAFMGVDYETFTLSVGPYYPSTQIVFDAIKKDRREVLANNLSAIYRFMHTTDVLTFKIVYSRTKSNFSSDEISEQLKVNTDSFPIGSSININNFNFKSYFLRVGVNYKLNDLISLGVDQIILKGEYDEKINGIDASMDYRHLNTSFSAKHSFSHYVSLKFYLNYFNNKHKYYHASEHQESKISTLKYGGIFELLF